MVRVVTQNKSLPQDNKELIVKLVGGGNIVNCRPLFSKDAKVVFVIRGPTIRSYSVQTGECVQDYEGLSSPAVGVQLHPHNDQVLVSCSSQGELIEWKWQTRLPGKIVKLKIPGRQEAINNFYLFQDESCRKSRYNILAMLTPGDRCYKRTAIYCSDTGELKVKLKLKLALHSHSFAHGNFSGENFFVGIYKNGVYATKQSDTDLMKQFIERDLHFTCVTCHHEKQIIATGDSWGRVLIWYDFLTAKQPTYTQYHWHTLAVRDVAFSQAGSFFYSGGSECVLVKWTLDDPESKSFLPRLPAPICHLSMGPDNQFVAVSTDDNAIQLVDPHKKITTVIQHLSWGVTVGLDRDPFAAGITRDPRTKTLVLNGRVGHVQFFCPDKKSLLYNLDITGQNYMTQEANRVIVNTDVISTAASGDGMWLATVEERDDRETSLESRLKFWQFDQAKRLFVLNTNVEMPHDGSTTSVRFQPTSDAAQLLAVTVGADCKFRMWSLIDTIRVNRPAKLWQCESVGFHKNLPTGVTGFSSDGSLLAVSFAAALTIWLPETNQLKTSLTHLDLKDPIRHIEFGCKDSSHLVVTASESSIGVWNLLSLSLAWVVDVKVSLLVGDPLSEFLAVFTPDNTLYVFSPESCEPVYERKNVTDSDTKILAATFVPHAAHTSRHPVWQSHSQLYFINSDQEMLTLDSAVDYFDAESLDVLPERSYTPLTPFAALMAQQSSSSVKRLKSLAQPQLGVVGASTVQEFMSSPAHTMPSLTLLCDSFLRSFTITRQVVPAKEENTEVMDVDSDEDYNKVAEKPVATFVAKDDYHLEKQLDPLLAHSYNWVKKFISIRPNKSK